MFDNARDGLNAILHRYEWVAPLAGILPLSALIDFVAIPPQLHFLQLGGAAPLWSWPVTPAASRLLLASDDGEPGGLRSCYLDRFGNSVALLGLDGRYGDRYYVSSPETTRLCVGAHRAVAVENDHENMTGDDLRLQTLEVVHVSRYHARRARAPWLRGVSAVFPRASSWRFLTRSAIGWVVWAAMIAMSIILGTYVSLAFHILMPMTGTVVILLYGINPRRLLVNNASQYNRLVLVTEHENAADWTVFYGESTLVNSLLNRPLQPSGPKQRASHTAALRMILRVFIVGQWALVLAAAALQDWNAYFISFWISLCIVVHAYVIPPPREAREWMKTYAGLRMERYRTVLSSRRALLSAVVALNPDTFAVPRGAQQEDRTRLDEGAMRWIDPILGRGPSRTQWEQATMQAMNEAVAQASAGEMVKSASYPSQEWKQAYHDQYWSRFTLEGIYMAAKMREQANLPGRMVVVEASGKSD